MHLNQEFESENFDLVEKYTYYINKILLVSFSAYFAPICVPLTAIILIFMYWKDKRSLFRESSFNYELTYAFTAKAISIAQFCIPVYAIGIIIFSLYDIKGHEMNIHPLNIIGLILACAFALLSYFLHRQIDEMLFSNYMKKKRENNLPYKSNHFERVYEKTNPTCEPRVLDNDL